MKILDFNYSRTGDSTAIIESFLRKPYEVYGSCTVWRESDNGQRLSTGKEAILADRWSLERHRLESKKG